MYNLKGIKKIMSMFLAVAIMIVTSFGGVRDVKKCFAATVKTIESNGVKYQVTYSISGNNYDITTENLSTKATANVDLNIKTKKGTITNTTYASNGKAVIVRTDYDGNSIVEKASSDISYDRKVEIDMDRHYYYRNGTKGKKIYLKIGRKSDSYKIRTDNLSSGKKKNCKSYQNYIVNGQSDMNKGFLNCAAAGVSSALIIALVLANIAFPPSVIVDIVLAVIGGGGFVATITKAINNFISAYNKQQKAANVYNTIKTYGTKL